MQTIIISRTDNLGDVVLSLPVAGKLKEVYPSSHIIFLGKKYTEPVISASIYIDEYWDKDQLDNYKTDHVDTIVFLFPDREVARWAAKRKIPLRIGTSHRWWHWLYCNKRVNFSRKKSNLHETQLNFKLLKPLGISETVTLNEISSLYGLKKIKTPIPAFLEEKLQQSSLKLVLHPKSKGSAREWPLKHYYELASSLPSTIQIFITGTLTEEAKIQEEFPEILTLPNVTNLLGKLSLQELISFLHHTDVLIACSTGPLHIASALGKYAIGLYPTIRPMHPGRWQPVGIHATTITFMQSDCNTCSHTPHQCFCIQNITPTSILNKIIAINHS
ncbi:glycosyltransferase family 9 protein [Xanthocytophaga agilis]|uniref:Glycosyltransferase family 9 protein n=1 Tax=Xanthocytophaga agilis TaxID=3048010 RepID=A0AAE3UAV8_9BACT|nr:glycosyltransferase family 9 protein [Xanthocytophaga agilis]MDJ1499138.1 glycosyltransferase family 9 protein [Xanthocytophaga agilis]